MTTPARMQSLDPESDDEDENVVKKNIKQMFHRTKRDAVRMFKRVGAHSTILSAGIKAVWCLAIFGACSVIAGHEFRFRLPECPTRVAWLPAGLAAALWGFRSAGAERGMARLPDELNALDWGVSFRPRSLEFCLNLEGRGAVGSTRAE